MLDFLTLENFESWLVKPHSRPFWRHSCCLCPISQFIQTQHPQVSVTRNFVWLNHASGPTFPLPKWATTFIAAYDGGWSIEGALDQARKTNVQS